MRLFVTISNYRGGHPLTGSWGACKRLGWEAVLAEHGLVVGGFGLDDAGRNVVRLPVKPGRPNLVQERDGESLVFDEADRAAWKAISALEMVRV